MKIKALKPHLPEENKILKHPPLSFYDPAMMRISSNEMFQKPFMYNLNHSLVFPNIYNLSNTLEFKHKGKKIYPCFICGRNFNKNYNRQIHYRIHTNFRPFQCSICSKRFKRQDHLKDHMSTHKKREPFTCPICHKEFSQARTLQSHQLLHNELDRNFATAKCNNASKTPGRKDEKFSDSGRSRLDSKTTVSNTIASDQSVCGVRSPAGEKLEINEETAIHDMKMNCLRDDAGEDADCVLVGVMDFSSETPPQLMKSRSQHKNDLATEQDAINSRSIVGSSNYAQEAYPEFVPFLKLHSSNFLKVNSEYRRNYSTFHVEEIMNHCPTQLCSFQTSRSLSKVSSEIEAY